ncbi:hypothetical protein [Acinetobacter nosocomialis]|uniref:hypothetical protein n=1 Tax=Acinetobacter nosocomialis TaxID=106654 RepID=UPI0033BE529B
MKILLMNDPSVIAIRKNHEALKGRKLIASGMFSGIFESGNPNTVLKLTACPASYFLLTDETLKIEDIHSPKLIKNYGQVGEYLVGKNVKETHLTKPNRKLVPLYLFEVEKLEKIGKGENRSLALNLTYELRRRLANLEHGHSVRGATAKILTELAKELPQLQNLPTVATYIKKLNQFVANYGDAFYDIHAANLMQRPDGTVVFSDPVGSIDIYTSGHGNFKPIVSLSDVKWTDVKDRHRQEFQALINKIKSNEQALLA